MYRLAEKTCFLAKLFTIGRPLPFNPILRPALVNQILVIKKRSFILIFQCSYIKIYEGKVIILRLARKAYFLEKVFTIGLLLPFNPILRPALVNQIFVIKKRSFILIFQCSYIKIYEGKVIIFRLAQKASFLAKVFTIGLALPFNPILRPALRNQIFVSKKRVFF
jgi:hypothetical protein